MSPGSPTGGAGFFRVLAALAVLALILVLALARPASGPLYALADGERGEREGEEEAEGGGLAKGLGSLAAWGGGVLIAGFVVFREAYPRLSRAGLRIPGRLYRSAITLHAATSVLLGLAGLYHGYILRSRAGAVEYALAGLIVYTLASGAALWLSRGNARRLARLVHVQRILTLAILILLLIHTGTIED